MLSSTSARCAMNSSSFNVFGQIYICGNFCKVAPTIFLRKLCSQSLLRAQIAIILKRTFA